jgi:hypothetical protein
MSEASRPRQRIPTMTKFLAIPHFLCILSPPFPFLQQHAVDSLGDVKKHAFAWSIASGAPIPFAGRNPHRRSRN